MSERGARSHRFSPLRLAVTIVGVIISVVSLIAGRIGLSHSGFGRNQLLALLLGVGIVLIGLLGRRFAGFYKAVAVLGLNSLILLGCLELGAGVILKFQPLINRPPVIAADTTLPRMTQLPYYATQDWAVQYERESSLLAQRYHPYVIWRNAPLTGTTINIDQDGIRRTPGSDCAEHSYKVFAFGGSTMWGVGAPDWGTIPAYLQKSLQSSRKEPVCVVNYGQGGYVSTQGVIQLLIELQAGDVPDLVIFYDGVNDTYAAFQSGQPSVHQDLDQIAARFEKKELVSPVTQLWRSTSLYKLLSQLVVKRDTPEVNYRTMGVDTEGLAASVIQTYLANYKMVDALAREYGFRWDFFWQPVIVLDQKPLTREEQAIKSRLEVDAPALIDLYAATYRKMEQAASVYDHLHSLVHVFDGQDAQIWIDLNHVTPVGNQLIAQEMLKVITSNP